MTNQERVTVFIGGVFICGMLVAAVITSSNWLGLNLVTAGEDTTEVRQSGYFNKIEASDSINVNIKVGDTNEIVVKAPSRVLAKIKTEVSSDTLKISDDGWYLWQTGGRTMQVDVTVKSLQEIKVLGSGWVNVAGLVTDNLSVTLSGSGDVEIQSLKINNRLTINLSGSGDINLQGQANNMEVETSGSGSAYLDKMEVQNARLKVTGSGDSQVKVINDLDVTISGSGDVQYAGNPRVNKSVTGSGDLQKL